MDLVSFENPTEYKMFEEVMIAGEAKQAMPKKMCVYIFFSIVDNISSIYTSGRKCNFRGKGCEQETFQPINVNGWFWAGAGNIRMPATNVSSPNTFWSPTGQ